jgi:hypothetical protein
MCLNMKRPFLLAANLAASILVSTERTALGIADDVTKDGDVAALQSGQQVELGLITALGWVRFTTDADWTQISMQTKGPMKTASFAIRADNNPRNTAGLGIVLYQVDSSDALAAYTTARQQVENGEKSRLGAWEIFNTKLKQGEAMYTVHAAFRDIADTHVAVRLVVPPSAKGAGSLDSQMEQSFTNLLKSFVGEVGSYPQRQDEKIRRPD